MLFMKKLNSRGFGAVGALLAVVVLAVVGGAGYYAYQSNQSKSNTASKEAAPSSNQPVSKDKVPDSSETTKPINSGWKRYESKLLKVSFEYPENWFVREDPATNRVYVSSHQGEFNKGSTPAGYQLLWLSAAAQEISPENEASVKSGSPKCCEAGPVTSSSLKAGSVTINTYEYQTVGGPALEAYWEIDGKRFYAHNGTELGNQDAMVTTLKQLLPTVKSL
jgi:hypothetical protein